MSLVRIVLILLMLSGTSYYAFSTLALRRHFRRSRQGHLSRHSCTVSILKPVTGIEQNLEKNLRTFIDQCDDTCEILFGVLDSSDPAVPLLRRLVELYPRASLHIGSDIDGTNNKVRILHALARHASGEILLITDADTRAEPGFVDRVLDPMRDERVGAVTCLYKGVGAKSLGDVLEGLHMTCVFAPGVASHNALAGIDFGLGAAIAVRSDILDSAGGFEALVDYLADDFQLGRMVHASGYEVRLSDEVIEITLGGESLAHVLVRDLRWSVTTRISRPWGHAGLVFTFGFAYAVCYLLASSFAVHAWLALIAVTCVRFLTAWLGAFRYLGDKEMSRKLHLLPLRDILSFLIWIASYLVRTVTWRGRKLRVVGCGKVAGG